MSALLAFTNVTSVVRRAFVVHGVAAVVGMLALLGSQGRFGSSEMVFCGGLVLGWLLGVPLSLLRLRPWVVFVGGLVLNSALGVVNVILATGFSSNMSAGLFEAFAGFAVVWTGMQFGASSSYALLAPRFDIAAMWLPLGLHVAAAVTWLNRNGVVDTWRKDKLAMWDGPSAALVSIGILFFVATLAARQRVSRARWQGPTARVESVDTPVVDKSRVVLLAAVLAVVVLLVTPFLFRTRAGCEDCTATPSTSSATTTSSSHASPAPRREPADWTWDDVSRALVDIATDAARLGAVVVVVVVASLPIVRRRRLRALAAPSSSLPPTERVRRRFRRALVALADTGVVVDGALLAPRGLLAAVIDVDEDGGPPAIVDAVGVWEQVSFGGRGLPDDAEERMAQAMGEIVAWSRARRTTWQALSTSFRVPSLR
jgi:hypothetical protein